MIDIEQNKIDVVYKYLKDEFPECLIEDKYSFDRCAQKFKVKHRESFYLVVISGEFFINSDVSSIYAELKKFCLAKHLQENVNSLIIVTSEGLEIEQK